MRFKNIKRLSAILLSLLIVAAVTFTTLASTIILNGTEAENAATPKYYGAVKDWSGVNNTADSDNVFSYQFGLDGANPLWDYMSYKQWDYWYTGETDFTNFSGLTEEEWSAKFKSDTFKNATGIGPKGYMRIWNRYGDLNLLDTIPATALAYTAKANGFINIPSHSVSIFSTYFTKNCGYRALVRITKNGENIYPSSGYLSLDETTQSVNIEDINITVNAGDIIRFELTANTALLEKNHGVGVNWNPLFYVQPETELYTNTSDILNGLTKFMNTVFSGKESQNMEVSDAQTLALEAAKRSKYGVYTALDSVYSDGVIMSNDDSIWKYAVSAVPYGFEMPSENYGIKSENSEEGTVISWDNTIEEIKAILVSTGGKLYTYMVAANTSYLTLPITEGEQIIQVSCATSASEIVKITDGGMEILSNVDNPVIYLHNTVNTSSGANSVYTLSNDKVASTYTVRYSYASFNSAATAQKGRTVYFNAKPNEQMMFGFTAPQRGIYEISAPIEAKRDIKYTVLKQDNSGEFILVDNTKSYNNNQTGYAALLEMKAGETVWLNALSDSDTQINIGIPRVTVKEKFTYNDGTAAYQYRALDYIENSHYNNKEYTTGSSTEKNGRVWEFGSFENPIDSNGNNDTLGYMNYTSGDDVSSLKNEFKPYEMIRSGNIYNPLAMVLNTSGKVAGTYSFGTVGTLHPTVSTAYLSDGAHREIGLPYQNKGFMVAVGLGEGKDGNTHNMGVYMKFTAPNSGNVTLNLSDFAQARTACRVLLIKDDKVAGIYSNIEKGTVAEIGYMNKGESIYICYGTDSGKVYNYGGYPVATVSGEKYSLNVDGKAQYSLSMDETVNLPAVSYKIGKALLGWIDENGGFYDAGGEFNSEKDTVLKKSDCYYGDITGDGEINASDMVNLRKVLINDENCNSAVSDVNSDEKTDIKDLVRMKRWFAGHTVTFNVR